MAIENFSPPSMSWLTEFVVLGEPASKANSRKVLMINGRKQFVKSDKAMAYIRSFAIQCPRFDPLLDGLLFVAIKIYYASRRPDLDESLILDGMQKVVYENDRQVRRKYVTWGLDKESPRAIIKIAKLELD